MRLRENLTGIWLMAMTLLSLCAFTCFFVAGMDDGFLPQLYYTLPVLQVVTLIVYLWGPEKLRSGLLKLAYRVTYASSFLVIPSLVFIFAALGSMYHARLTDVVDAKALPVEEIVPTGETVVYDTGTVYVIFPEYSDIDLVVETRPARADKSITWCSGAAFQHEISLTFDQVNVEGDHAVEGTLYESPYNDDIYAAFTFADGAYDFEFDNPTQAVREAADAGGSGFMQMGVIRDGEIILDFERQRVWCARVLAELNGHVCLIDTVNMTHAKPFFEELQRLGVTNAVYMDMGAGWNYSWYRDATGRVVPLFALPVPWSHNWIVFRK